MANLRQKIPILQSNAIASYDFVDIAEGTGTVVFYFCGGVKSSTLVRFLTRNTEIRNDNNVGSGGTDSPNNTNGFDYDLSPFNTSSTISGTGYFFANLENNNVSGVDQSLTISIIKVDANDNETTLSSKSTQDVPDGGTTENVLVVFDDIPDTHFSSGEKLRVNVINDDDNDVNYTIDPSGTAQSGRAQARVLIPFKLDL